MVLHAEHKSNFCRLPLIITLQQLSSVEKTFSTLRAPCITLMSEKWHT